MRTKNFQDRHQTPLESLSKTRVLVPFIAYFALSGLLYLVFIYRLQEIMSVLIIVPLLVWIRRYNSPRESSRTPTLTGARRPILATVALYLIVMSVRTPSVVFLGFPIEKAPLIFLLVLLILYVKHWRLSDFGLTTRRMPNQALMGGFLYLFSQILPVFIGATVLVVVYRFNPGLGVDWTVLLGSLPFQFLAVGISEEGFFRGYIQTRAKATFGVPSAILYQASLFGLWHVVWHLNPLDIEGMIGHVVGSFLFGLFTGVFYYRTRNIAGLAVFHGLTNSVQLGTQFDLGGLTSTVAVPIIVSIDVLIIVFSTILVVFSRQIAEFFKTGSADRQTEITNSI